LVQAIARYPETSRVTLEMRPVLNPLFKGLKDGVSEFSFANIYLFRSTHNYMVSELPGGLKMVTGLDGGKPFFMLPFGLPDERLLKELFERFHSMKAIPEKIAAALERLGFEVAEDRDNFDYLYSREEMAELSGRKFHKKKNLVNLFTGTYNYEGRPLTEEYKKDASGILEAWHAAHPEPSDYEAALEALKLSEELQLCGGIYFVEGVPAAYILGEELTPEMFVVHFEKGAGEFKGLLQFVNQSFASILPEKYDIINREQDLGDLGLRRSKESYRPVGFVKKYRAFPAKR
jgi:uncharacterized protein